MNSYHIGAKIE